MIIAYWIVAGLAALGFAAAGVTKLIRPRSALVASGMAWAEDLPPASIKFVAAAEILGAIGLILPLLIGVLPALSPIAGTALAVLMVAAIVVHVRRREAFIPALVVGLVAAIATALGFILIQN